jgi:hypothetical protein
MHVNGWVSVSRFKDPRVIDEFLGKSCPVFGSQAFFKVTSL